MASGTDLNTVTTAGLYYVAQPVNAPVPNSTFYLEIAVSSDDASFLMQRLMQIGSTSGADQSSQIFVRTHEGSVWNPWIKLSTQGCVSNLPVGTAGPQGPVGPQGPAGPQGSIGAQGPIGSVGRVGPVGPEGPQGSIGPQGPIGDTGSVGPQGESGPIGPIGPQGATGATGAVGETGPAGSQGDVGPAGPKGDTGDVGPQGAQGATGDTGPAGPQGEVGPTGPQGIQGPVGETGAVGPQGEVGPIGPQGAIGEKGDAGIGIVVKGSVSDPAALPTTGNTTGDTFIVSSSGEGYALGDGYTWNGNAWQDVGPIRGPIGPQGLAGDTGPAGPQGETGASGAKGETGDVGPQGPAGSQGEVGPTGPQGPVGETGPAGATGPVGPQGDTGAAGPKGETGSVGPQGPAGTDIGFTPIQQGGGIGQTDSKVYLGYSDAGKLKVTVDGTDLGALLFEGEGTDGSSAPVDAVALSKAINARAGLFNVVDYGAVANQRDATTMAANVSAFQAAFTDIQAAGGGTIVIPAGNFCLNAQVGGSFTCDVGIVGTTQHSGLLFADMQDQNGLVLHAPGVRFTNMRVYTDNAPNIGQGSLVDLETTGEFRGVVVRDVMLQGSPSGRPGTFLNVVNAATGFISGVTIEGGANEAYGSQSTGIAISANTLATDVDIENAKIFRVFAGIVVQAGNIQNVPTFEGISFTDCNLVGVQIGVQISSGWYTAPGLGWKGGHVNAQKYCFSLNNYAQFSVSDAVLYMDSGNNPQAHIFCNGCYSIGVKDCYFGYIDGTNSGARPAVTGVALANTTHVQIIGNEFSLGLVPSSNAIWNQTNTAGVRAAFNMRTGATSNGVGFVGTINAMIGNDGV